MAESLSQSLRALATCTICRNWNPTSGTCLDDWDRTTAIQEFLKLASDQALGCKPVSDGTW